MNLAAHKQQRYRLFGATILIVGSAWVVQAQDDSIQSALNVEQTFISAVELAEKSVVSISRTVKENSRSASEELNPFGLKPQQFEQGGEFPAVDSADFVPSDFGAGIIIAPTGDNNSRFILTNYHVVKGGPTSADQQKNAGEYDVFVRFANRSGYFATIYAADPRSDLALLQIDFKQLQLSPTDLQPIVWDKENTSRKGQMVLALGNPYAIGRDGSASVSWGIISNISRRPGPEQPQQSQQAAAKMTLHDYGTLLHLDARLDPGTSGGALINLRGELIGVTTALAALEGYPKSVGFAVPMSKAVRRIVNTLLLGEEVEYGFLGVHLRDMQSQEHLTLRDESHPPRAPVLVQVFPHSPAHQGGFISGDVILAVNEYPVYNQYDLMRYVSALGPGTDATFRIWRERTKREYQLTTRLGKWPVFDDDGIVAPHPKQSIWRGIRVDYPTGRERYIRQPFVYQAAVVIIEVVDGSIADQAGLKPGDFISHIDGEPVVVPDDFYREVQIVSEKTATVNVVGRDLPVKLNSK